MNNTTIKYALLVVLASLFLTTSAQAGFLYTLNSNEGIYGYAVDETTGALTPLAGFPVATGSNGQLIGASEALTIDRTNHRLYALNVGAKTVSAYSINAMTGALTALPFSPIALPAQIGNAFTIAVHPSGSPLIVGGYEACASYNITATTATTAAGSPFSFGSSTWPSSSVFSLNGNYFYTGGIPLVYYPYGPSHFVGFSVNQATGVLTLLPGSPFDSGNFGAIGYATDAQGRLFMANVDTSVVRAFTTSSGVPSGVSGNPFPGNTITPSDGVLHPNGNFYVVTDYLQYAINSHQIAGSGSATTMNLVSQVNSLIAGMVSVVFNQEGTFLYGASDDSLRIMTYSFNPTTGALAFSNAQPPSTNGTLGYLVGIDYLPSPPPIVYNFTGFFSPVNNAPTVNKATAGSAIPVKFSLGGNQGLNIFAAGHPASQSIGCISGVPVDVIEETVTAGSSSLSYDATTDQYKYVWKTSKAWKGTCRKLSLKFSDGTTQEALFQFK